MLIRQYLMRAIFRTVLSAAALFLCASCFDDPILEKLSLEFHPDSTITVASTVEFRHPSEFDSKPQRARVELVRTEFENHTDVWSRRFSGVSFQREKSSVVYRVRWQDARPAEERGAKREESTRSFLLALRSSVGREGFPSPRLLFTIRLWSGSEDRRLRVEESPNSYGQQAG